MSASPPPVRLIAGPTASGKSAFALRLAAEAGGLIVNADSMQLYRDLRVLTARPSSDDEAQAEHRLYGVADATDAWSVGRWLRAALPVIEAARTAGRTVFVVGGTGLYFRALTVGLADTPEPPTEVREQVAARLEAEGEAAFRSRLAERDPTAAARIAPGDRQRLLRAAAVAEATGRSLTDWQAATRAPLSADAWEGSVLAPPREALYARCDARVDAMLEAGALDEVDALRRRGLDPALPALKAVGFREFAAALAGELSLPEAVTAAKQATRNYAKRQLTWFRNQTADWLRVLPS